MYPKLYATRSIWKCWNNGEKIIENFMFILKIFPHFNISYCQSKSKIKNSITIHIFLKYICWHMKSLKTCLVVVASFDKYNKTNIMLDNRYVIVIYWMKNFNFIKIVCLVKNIMEKISFPTNMTLCSK